MKIRSGFVSNSSSASFVVSLRVLSAMEYRWILDYLHDPNQNTDGWSCHEERDWLKGYTTMDNRGFRRWLKEQDMSDKVKFKDLS